MESNGNFHGAPVAYVLDFLAIAVADLASIAERRTDRLLDKNRSHGLPPFLADDAGVDSGLMIAQYTQAALVGELKRLAVPASADSIPSSAMQEDHVSMGWSAARKLRTAVDNLTRVVAVELYAAARAVELREGSPRPGDAGGAEGAAAGGRGRPRPRPLSGPRPRRRGGVRTGRAAGGGRGAGHRAAALKRRGPAEASAGPRYAVGRPSELQALPADRIDDEAGAHGQEGRAADDVRGAVETARVRQADLLAGAPQ